MMQKEGKFSTSAVIRIIKKDNNFIVTIPIDDPILGAAAEPNTGQEFVAIGYLKDSGIIEFWSKFISIAGHEVCVNIQKLADRIKN